MTTLPTAWVVDVDGTLALCPHRNPYDWRSAHLDLPNEPVIIAVQALAEHQAVAAIIAISGRHEEARQLTEQWLVSHRVPYRELLMRGDGDYRPDDVVKEELFRARIDGRYSVIGVIDDRTRVVDMWRRLGLTCLQVADGNF
jgi:hypothetical protein